jgi:hypothetical protein
MAEQDLVIVGNILPTELQRPDCKFQQSQLGGDTAKFSVFEAPD